eukprot:3198728-Amphidinium_carterae.2
MPEVDEVCRDWHGLVSCTGMNGKWRPVHLIRGYVGKCVILLLLVATCRSLLTPRQHSGPRSYGTTRQSSQ